MKIVIDIPNDLIKSLEQGSFGAKYNMYDLVGCVMNGTPLNDLLDKICAEIEQTAKDYDKFDDYRRVRGLWIALNIIDRHKAESEE